MTITRSAVDGRPVVIVKMSGIRYFIWNPATRQWSEERSFAGSNPPYWAHGCDWQGRFYIFDAHSIHRYEQPDAQPLSMTNLPYPSGEGCYDRLGLRQTGVVRYLGVDTNAKKVAVIRVEFEAPAGRPEVTITAPADNSRFGLGVAIDLQASATDQQDGDISGQGTWSSSLDGDLGSGGSLRLDDLSRGSHSLSWTATDSDGQTARASIRVTVGDLDPELTISSPLAGSLLRTDSQVMLQASAIDPEDGDIGAGITWSSDREGLLGDGDTLAISTLSEGAHLITASVEDAHGNRVSATVAVEVVETGSGAFIENAGLVVIEAEHFTANHGNGDISDWRIRTDTEGWLGDGFVDTPDEGAANANWATAAALHYDLTVTTAGSYWIWMRRQITDSAGNSAWVGMDGSQVGDLFYDSNTSGWVWARHDTTVHLERGASRFELRRREDGYQVDRIILTSDPGFTPDDSRDQESPREKLGRSIQIDLPGHSAEAQRGSDFWQPTPASWNGLRSTDDHSLSLRFQEGKG